MQAITVAQARALDREAVERFGMPSILLMENAARAVADEARCLGDRFVILCGSGNNGGDGLAAARHLGRRARVHLLAEPDPERHPDAALQLAILRAAGHEVLLGVPPDPIADGSAVWIDALFGTGLVRPITGEARRWIERFNATPGARLGVDIPSGLHGDTGEVLGIAARCHRTVTFAAPKVGMLVPSAREYVGELLVAPLGIPETGTH
ncbi:MAG TPA: NAD(P)H-hydrate epimerase [Planctomycetota bacterium]|nr:NAD(P)H-hydrate epimerase [Planctomycetota bacterium]